MTECTCRQEKEHATYCEVWKELDARIRRIAEAVEQYRERRATGLKLFRTPRHAVGWYFRTRHSWATAKSIPLEQDSGRPSRGADDPGRRTFAAVVAAIDNAITDDKERNPTTPAPLLEWLALAHYHEQSYERISWRDEYADWSLDQIKRRMSRAHRVIWEHLQGRFTEEEGDSDR